jgi:hypothetical protein
MMATDEQCGFLFYASLLYASTDKIDPGAKWSSWKLLWPEKKNEYAKAARVFLIGYEKLTAAEKGE